MSMVQNTQPIAIGTWVQYNAAVQNPLAPGPSPDEQGIGIIRQAFNEGTKTYYQVVWNPGNAQPKSALYTTDQLCPLTTQDAQRIICEMQSGQYTPANTTVGALYQQPNIPTVALPPSLQGSGGSYTPSGGEGDPEFTESSQ